MKSPESNGELYGPGVEISPCRPLTKTRKATPVSVKPQVDLLEADRLFGEQVRRENAKIHTKILQRMLGKNFPIDADPG